MTSETTTLNPGLPRIRVFQTWVHGVNRRTAAERLHALLEDGRPHQVVTVNLDFLRIARSMPAFNQIINEADLAVPDGKPIVWIARYLGLRACERVTGPELMEACAELSALRGYRMFFLGAAPGVAEQAAKALAQRYPGAQVCGAFSPPESDYPFPPEVDCEMVSRVRAAAPDVLFVAFGCPKQDLWIAEHKDGLGVPVSIGVGGSFNFLSGEIPRAPRRLQGMGLEWTHRLYREPRRLWRRYLLQDVPFAGQILLAEGARRIGLSQIHALALEL